MDRIDILGVGFDNVTMGEAVRRALDMALNKDGRSRYIVTPNSEIVYLCKNDEAVRDSVNGADMVVPDGVGVIYASRILKNPLKEKVAGYELGENILPGLAEKGLKLFLLGAKPGVAALAAEKLLRKNPGLVICGFKDGFFKKDSEAVDAINASGADVVFVCLGAPKQEFWMRKNKDAVRASLMIGLGGSLDGYSGKTDRGPEIFIKLGLEWFYRLCREPKRAKRMTSLPKFMLLAVGARLKGNKK